VTYSGDPSSSNTDAVRFLVGDTDPADVLLTDDEIDWLLSVWIPKYDSVTYVAAVAAEVIAGKFAREVSMSADGVSIGVNELQQKYESLAASLRDQYKAETTAVAPDVGGMLWDEEFDSSIKPLVWAKGMHDNPEAGRQEYGGTGWTEIPPEVYQP
jgi:hypothetical protein